MSKHPPHIDDPVDEGQAGAVAVSEDLGTAYDQQFYDREADPDTVADFAPSNSDAAIIGRDLIRRATLDDDEAETVVLSPEQEARLTAIESVVEALRSRTMFGPTSIPPHVSAEQIVRMAEYVVLGETNF